MTPTREETGKRYRDRYPGATRIVGPYKYYEHPDKPGTLCCDKREVVGNELTPFARIWEDEREGAIEAFYSMFDLQTELNEWREKALSKQV